jgi:hypothetical protein
MYETILSSTGEAYYKARYKHCKAIFFPYKPPSHPPSEPRTGALTGSKLSKDGIYKDTLNNTLDRDRRDHATEDICKTTSLRINDLISGYLLGLQGNSMASTPIAETY